MITILDLQHQAVRIQPLYIIEDYAIHHAYVLDYSVDPPQSILDGNLFTVTHIPSGLQISASSRCDFIWHWLSASDAVDFIARFLDTLGPYDIALFSDGKWHVSEHARAVRDELSALYKLCPLTGGKRYGEVVR